MASTSATLSLSSPSTLIDTRAPRQSSVTSSLQCPNLSAPLDLSQNRSWKAAAYCRKLRNVFTMATTEIATGEVTTEVAPPAEEPAAVTEDTATETPEILKSVQAAWDKIEDKYAVSSLAVAVLVALVGVNGLVSAIDRLPLVPGVFELVGIGYTGWFAYKNLFFTPDREALIAKIKNTYQEILS